MDGRHHVVASAGNRGRDGYLTINAPGNDPYVLTVGAMNDLNTAEPRRRHHDDLQQPRARRTATSS